MNIHFIGIGGIGVSALAKYYLSQGARVSGSDLVPSEITDELERLGVKISIGRHKKSNLPKNVGKVIYTAAISKDNPELRAAQYSYGRIRVAGAQRAEARYSHAKIQSYPEAVGELTRKYKAITVSGAHGKTTTTALIALILEEGYLDPTVIVGAKIREFNDSNFRQGSGSHLVLEADEWNRSFLKYFPKIAVITNIDAEHLDTYKNVAGVETAFGKYLEKVPADGTIVANYDDPRTRKIAKKFGKRVQWYSLADRDAAFIKNSIKIPGSHNVSNALAAARVGRLFGIKDGHILAVISRFSGAWRRFEFKGVVSPVRGSTSNGAGGVFIFSDYAHHPNEIYATIAAARERFPFRRIWCVYQPHQYQRLAYLWNDFIGAFDMADRVCLLPVYDVAGRETKKARAGVNSEKLAYELLRRGKDACYLYTFEETKGLLHAKTRPGDVVLIMGAGDIYNLAGDFSKTYV